MDGWDCFRFSTTSRRGPDRKDTRTRRETMGSGGAATEKIGETPDAWQAREEGD